MHVEFELRNTIENVANVRNFIMTELLNGDTLLARGGALRTSVVLRFGLGVENEQADAGRDSQTCHARPIFQA